MKNSIDIKTIPIITEHCKKKHQIDHFKSTLDKTLDAILFVSANTFKITSKNLGAQVDIEDRKSVV